MRMTGKFSLLTAGSLAALILGLVLPQGTSAQTFVFNRDVVGLPETIQQLAQGSTLIVDVHVESIYPAYSTSGFPGLETDTVFRINRVLKGTNPGARIVVSQIGGQRDGYREVSDQFPMIRPAAHYLLFLSAQLPDSIQRPERSGIPRYYVAGVYAGVFEFSDKGFRVNSDLPRSLIAEVDRKSIDQVISEISASATSKQP